MGPVHLYASEERLRRIRLPARLFGNLTEDTADALVKTMKAQGLDVRRVGAPKIRSAGVLSVGIAGAITVLFVFFAVLGWEVAMWTTFGVGLLATLLATAHYNSVKNWVARAVPRFRLRSYPAALPASDPLVARLAGLLHEGMPGDVRDVVGELALLVQRLVDHRAQHVRDSGELDMLIGPVEPLVAAVERLVARLEQIGRELSELDEGTMVRALAASRARGEGAPQRESLLLGLDRLRALEDQRGEVFHRLLEARSLLTRTVEMGLEVHDEGLEHERQLALATATLGGS